MNAFVRRTIARRLAPLAALALAAAPAAFAQEDGPLEREIRGVVDEGNVNVSIDAGVATLTGYADAASKAAAEDVALADDGVERVVNLIVLGS